MSVYSDQGTAAHQVLENLLNLEMMLSGLMCENEDPPLPASSYLGQQIEIPADEEGDHHALGPSSAKRWRTCSASYQHTKDVQSEPEGARTVEFTAEDAAAVAQAHDYVRTRVKQLARQCPNGVAGVVVHAERKVTLAPYLQDLGVKHPDFYPEICDGTSDVTILVPSLGYVEQIDYKHGAGVPVSIDDPQNDHYLLGALAAETDPTVYTHGRCTIIQPRCTRVEAIRSRDIEDLGEWYARNVAELRTAVHEVFGDTRFMPSEDNCRWCAKGKNAGRNGIKPCESFLERAFGLVPDAHNFDPEEQSPGLLVDLVLNKELITGAIAAAEEFVKLQLALDPTGYYSDFFEIGPGRGSTQYTIEEQEDLIKALKKIKVLDPVSGKHRSLGKKEMYQESLKSPAQMRKTFATFSLSDLETRAVGAIIAKVPGKPKLIAKAREVPPPVQHDISDIPVSE